MPIIKLETKIKSTIEICFDLSRSIDLHKISTAHTHEEAIAGKTSGLIGLGEFVTWQAVHFGIKQKLTTEITAFNKPYYFKDEQRNGAFKSFAHDHLFETTGEWVIMKDIFQFTTPGGFLGRMFNALMLTRYMTKLLCDRNKIIKEFAETDQWKMVIHKK